MTEAMKTLLAFYFLYSFENSWLVINSIIQHAMSLRTFAPVNVEQWAPEVLHFILFNFLK